MRRILSTAGLAGLLGACASVTPIYGPDGKPYSRIECNGAIQTLDACYEKALQVCPGGYVLADESRQTRGTVSARYAYGFGAAPIYRHIVVACK